MYRIPEGAIIAGVCNGIAAYLRVDVAIVRILFVALLIVTKGFALIAYVALMFALPEANTPEARAAATDTPFNAREIVDRAKRQYEKGSKEWRRQWRQQRRQWRRQGWAPGMTAMYAPVPWTAPMLPVLGLVQLGLFLTMAAMVVSLVNTGQIMGWYLPEDVPRWGGVLGLLIAYQIAVSPLKAAQYWSALPQPGVDGRWVATSNAITALVGLAIVLWISSDNMPAIREFLRNMPELFREFGDAMRRLFAER